jgi:hypothetical protein
MRDLVARFSQISWHLSGVFPEGWIEVLEFSVLFRGISFCKNAGVADTAVFAPGTGVDVSASKQTGRPEGSPYIIVRSVSEILVWVSG